MHRLTQNPELNTFFPQSVNDHLQKMFCDPVFSVSDILKKFLSFIIAETLEGRSLMLKEYTIGVNVLNKPLKFNPRVDGIVRIHAGRLRRALNQYYMGTGKLDPIRISVPKGNYIPFFFETGFPANAGNKLHGQVQESGLLEHRDTETKVAVLPFNYFTKEDRLITFAEGMASQLSTKLAGNHRLIVIAYNPLRFLYNNPFQFKDALLKAGARFLYSGDIQFYETRIRVNIQMTDAVSCEQIWCKCYDRQLKGTNMLDIQDEIIKQVVAESGVIWNSKKPVRSRSSAMAVA